jgi:ech hydrogenase subunit D
VQLTANDLVLPSISGVYFSAFLYENEIHDLFGISITDIALDYKGKFYQTAGKFPFKPVALDASNETK